MPKKKKIQEERQEPSLFDVPKWEEFRESLIKYQEYARNGDATCSFKFRGDTMFVMPPLTMVPRIEAYIRQMVPNVKKYLTEGGMDEKDADVILRDYQCVLWCGAQVIHASPQQMAKTLSILNPAQAFIIDRWGLYSCLLSQYDTCLNRLTAYREKLDGPDATPGTRAEFWLEPWNTKNGAADYWLSWFFIQKRKDITKDEKDAVFGFINKAIIYAQINAFLSLHYICKYAYNATDGELSQIQMTEDARFIDRKMMMAKAKTYSADVFDAVTKAGQEMASAIADIQKATKAAKWRNNAKNVGLPVNVLSILSRSVEVSKICKPETAISIMMWVKSFYNQEDEDGNKINERFLPHTLKPKNTELKQGDEENLPEISEGQKIESSPEVRKTKEVGGINALSIQKAIEGVCLLPMYVKGVSAIGSISYRTTITFFTEVCCGYQNANWTTKMSLLGSLLALNDLYVIVRRPVRWIDQEWGDKKRKRVTGGVTMVKLLTVQEINKNTGEIIITTIDGAIKGPFICVDKNKALTMTNISKMNLPKSRFNYQILQKTNIKEMDLMYEIFGYDQLKKDAEASRDADTIRRTNKYISGHTKRSLECIRKWFEEYKKAGIIASFKYREKTNVYEWGVKDTSKIENDVMKPDELLPGTSEIQHNIEDIPIIEAE